MTAAGGPAVLFTGFPGFIGVRLLPRLMELSPSLRFVCLVQPRFAEAARASLEEIERARRDLAGRTRLLEGDITHAALGLEAGAAQALRATLVGAHHLAAVYDLAVARDLALKVNVEGTRNVVRFLAECPRLEGFHYVSTCYVSGTATGEPSAFLSVPVTWSMSSPPPPQPSATTMANGIKRDVSFCAINPVYACQR